MVRTSTGDAGLTASRWIAWNWCAGPVRCCTAVMRLAGRWNALSPVRTRNRAGAHYGIPGCRTGSHPPEQSHVGRAGVALNAGESLGFTGGATFKDYDDVRGGEDVGEQPQTGYREGDADAKLEWRLSPEERLVFAFQSVNQDNAWRSPQHRLRPRLDVARAHAGHGPYPGSRSGPPAHLPAIPRYRKGRMGRGVARESLLPRAGRARGTMAG